MGVRVAGLTRTWEQLLGIGPLQPTLVWPDKVTLLAISTRNMLEQGIYVL
jgi:hypothetical protein